MGRYGFYFLLLLLVACSNSKDAEQTEEGENYGQFVARFSEGSLPYALTDTALLNNKDTNQIRQQNFIDFIPDSLTGKWFGSKAKVRYVPLAQFNRSKDETYYLVKASSGNKRAALLVVADEAHNFKALIPFLVPDADPTTWQTSVLEKNYAVSRGVIRRKPGETMAEGKDVFAYSSNSNNFELIMTDPLDDENLELINPIDTLPRTHKLAGDFRRDKKNIVSVRDGRKPGLLTVFIHIEKSNGSCSGEIKGDAEITSPTTAVYRQAGDPCVLNIKFGKNAVTLEEQEGCGSKRGLECSFNGNYPRKKETKPKESKKEAAK